MVVAVVKVVIVVAAEVVGRQFISCRTTAEDEEKGVVHVLLKPITIL